MMVPGRVGYFLTRDVKRFNATAKVFMVFDPVSFDINYFDSFTSAAHVRPAITSINPGWGRIKIILIAFPIRGRQHSYRYFRNEIGDFDQIGLI